MSCERNQDALTAAAAGGPVPADLGAHLASCERCRGELADLRRALALADAEMSALAAAEPSPGLSARILQAAAASDPASAWGIGWLWPATAVAAALLVALAVWVGRTPATGRQVAVGERSRVTPRESPLPAEPGNPPSAAAGRTAPRGPAVRPADPSRAGSVGRARVVPAPPEVLVPRGEAEALVRFAAIVYRGRQAPGAFLAAGHASPDLVEPAALDITPLEIVPLDPAETPGT